MAKNHYVNVHIADDGNGNYTTTDSGPSDPPVKPGHYIKWYFHPPTGFPADAVYYLRFFVKDTSGNKQDDDGCMHGKHWNNGLGESDPGEPSIDGRVGNTAQGGYKYLIGFRDQRGGKELLDPEIIVEGSPEPVKGYKKSKKAKKKAAKKSAAAGRKKPAKKSAKKKAGKKAKKAKKASKAKKAKRSTKRKAKKR